VSSQNCSNAQRSPSQLTGGRISGTSNRELCDKNSAFILLYNYRDEWSLCLQPDDKKKKYHQLKDLNEHLLKQLENGQQELDQLNLKKTELEEVCPVVFLTFCYSLFYVILLFLLYALSLLDYESGTF